MAIIQVYFKIYIVNIDLEKKLLPILKWQFQKAYGFIIKVFLKT